MPLGSAVLMRFRSLLVLAAALFPAALAAQGERSTRWIPLTPCTRWDEAEIRRNPTAAELRCRFGIRGSGRFGLVSYADVPVYQPRTPLPGTHIVGVPGLPGPRPGESFEEWEWRVHRTTYGPEVTRARRGLEVLHPIFAGRLMVLEQLIAAERLRAVRRETWRSPDRQAWIFQQGRSRSGSLATTTLTSWHSQVDSRGQPAARAADYEVAARDLPRFHLLAQRAGLESYGADSNDPGHVYLPTAEQTPFTGAMLALMRTLPRVPYVTLATGRPTDELPTPAERAAWREAALRWATEPFWAAPRLEIAGLRALRVWWTERAEARAAPKPVVEEPRKEGRRKGKRYARKGENEGMDPADPAIERRNRSERSPEN